MVVGVRYVDPEAADRSFVTANEIHIPVGQPVKLRLRSAAVIHFFWVPALGGKTDLIPGQENMTWLQADKAGVWEGRCVEYCGLQHANMALRVFADPPDAFDAWMERERRATAQPTTEGQRQGRTVFLQTCGACHRVRGTPARGRVGPDLTHLMSRSTMAGGILPNTPEQLTAWITDPQALKPGAYMPAPHLTEAELAALLAWLGTLE
ncbi:c-type cytochrome [Rhodobacter sp. NSM]|uniref:c-type cytochrome n=1 Tax=Rhodobacter sp. NSM TaxID=3457501 RepID=UPI003FD69319